MSTIENLNIDATRVHRYAHPRAWLADSHPPYRYHLDNVDISSILGLCWESPWSTWQQIRSQQLTPPRIQQLNQMLKWTPILRRLFEAHTNRPCDLDWRRITHEELDWAKTSLFSVSYDASEGEYGGVLYYTSSKPEQFAEDGAIIEKWSKELLPANIAMEAYWALLCSGVKFIDIAVAFSSHQEFVTMRVIRLYSDLDIQQGIQQAARSWRERHLIQGTPPQLDGSRECSEHLMEQYRHGGQRIRKASLAEEHLLQEYNLISEQLKALQEQQRTIRNQLFAQVGPDKGFHTSDGSKAIVSRSQRGFQLRTFIKTKEDIA